MERCVVATITRIDIGMSIKKRLDIFQRALLGCFNKSTIELLLLLLLFRCHWCLSLMFAQYRLNQIKSSQIKCATIFDSHDIECRGRPNTLNREQRDDCARDGGREEMRARERQRATTRERERSCGCLSLISCVCVSSIDDSHDSLRE